MIFFDLLLAASLSAAGSGPDPVRLMFLDASSCRFIIMQNATGSQSATDKVKFDSDRAKALADLERHAPDGIKSASGSAELEAAVKTFYTAADSYCKNPSDAGEDEYKAKKRALDDLLQAAGR